MSFESLRAVADAVLLEGYVLYPYRASAPKNRYRWTFGVLAPRAWSEAGGCEAWWMEAQVLVEPGREAPALDGRLRFLQLRRRGVEAARDGGLAPVDRLELPGRLLVPFEEGDLREVALGVALVPGAGLEVPFALEGDRREEALRGEDGALAGRVVQERWPVQGRVLLSCERVPAERPLLRVRIRVENLTAWEEPRAPRERAMRASCLSAHLLLAVEGGALVSLLDPPPWARAAAAACRSTRLWPVLAGEPGRRDLALAAPIILYDHPQVAPESGGDFFDATEIDELLALRTATLTEDEKRQVRATDPRAAEVLARVEGLPPELMRRLHGAARGLAGAEMVPRAPPAGDGAPGLTPGRRVRLKAPGDRRTDAQDLLYAGRTATVEKVVHDLSGEPLLAVTIDGDPAAELHRWKGRFHYYRLDEVDLLPAEDRP
ncbi:hypothetical protein [Anaeromyxobacter paludicola]|uniref:Uncharacterized protein n=1 Tax=Anaeromyxobacter paludicola TaxID=2918171 RepID=A0ABN6N7D7_9BACT|nr:hypothetical protein [Anaeromyxobacter paludicola]BDG07949.1 hypothetical protein AMPC_10620 [Anaeromyxobacter paludicola]